MSTCQTICVWRGMGEFVTILGQLKGLVLAKVVFRIVS